MFDHAFEMLKTKSSSLLIPTHSGSSSSSSSTATSSSSTTASHTHSHTHSASATPTWLPGLPTVEQAGHTGQRTLWVIFVGMLLSSLVFGFMAYRVPVQKRLFHILTTFITVFATLSYFAMAVGYNNPGHGNSFHEIVIKDDEAPGGISEVILRQVFWARYVDWSVTTPLLLLDLAFLAGMNGANILVAVVADIIMILTGMFAAFGTTGGEKWGWYAMGCLAYLVVIWQLAVPGRKAVMAKDASTSKLFAYIAGYTLILWTLYPIVWGIGDGSRKMSVDAEIICYAVLDVLAKPVFGFWLLFTHCNNAATSLEGFWSNGLSGEGSIRIDDDEGA